MSAARIPSNPAPAQSVEEKIRIRAFLLFEKRGGEPGHELEDWLQAEAEILGSKPSAPAIRFTPFKKSRAKRTSATE